MEVFFWCNPRDSVDVYYSSESRLQIRDCILSVSFYLRFFLEKQKQGFLGSMEELLLHSCDQLMFL